MAKSLRDKYIKKNGLDNDDGIINSAGNIYKYYVKKNPGNHPWNEGYSMNLNTGDSSSPA